MSGMVPGGGRAGRVAGPLPAQTAEMLDEIQRLIGLKDRFDIVRDRICDSRQWHDPLVAGGRRPRASRRRAMEEHEHAAGQKPAARPVPGEPTKDAGARHPAHNADHARMVVDFRMRVWLSLIVTLPILVLPPMLQSLVGLREASRFPGDIDLLSGLPSSTSCFPEHWIETKSVMGVSRALEELATLMPSDAHTLMPSDAH